MCYLCCCCYSVLADCSRPIADDLQEVGLQGPDKEAPTSRCIPRINNEPSRPTEGVRFCLSERSAPFHQQVLFESNTYTCVMLLQVIQDITAYELASYIYLGEYLYADSTLSVKATPVLLRCFTAYDSHDMFTVAISSYDYKLCSLVIIMMMIDICILYRDA